MQIHDLDYALPAQPEIVGGATPKAIAVSGATATGSGLLSITKTSSLTRTAANRYQAVSTGGATALSITRPYQNTSGILASGRATVSSLGMAQS